MFTEINLISYDALLWSSDKKHHSQKQVYLSSCLLNLPCFLISIFCGIYLISFIEKSYGLHLNRDSQDQLSMITFWNQLFYIITVN